MATVVITNESYEAMAKAIKDHQPNRSSIVGYPEQIELRAKVFDGIETTDWCEVTLVPETPIVVPE